MLEFGDQKTQAILVELQDIWVFSSLLDILLTVNLAPEVMCRQNHGVAVDYFAMGVMAYEFMMGRVSLISSEFCSN